MASQNAAASLTKGSTAIVNKKTNGIGRAFQRYYNGNNTVKNSSTEVHKVDDYLQHTSASRNALLNLSKFGSERVEKYSSGTKSPIVDIVVTSYAGASKDGNNVPLSSLNLNKTSSISPMIKNAKNKQKLMPT